MHCDDIIHNYDYPICLRYYLLVNRLPAIDKVIITGVQGEPKCFAMYEGNRVRLVMASRMGDVGITNNLDAESGYTHRVGVDELSDFTGEKS